MHVEGAQRLASVHDEPAELLRVLSGLRWRLGLERTLLFVVRGAIGSALTLIALSVAAWLTTTADIVVWPASVPVVAALGFGLARWPSHRQAALSADRRLALEERLGTAVELARGTRAGRFDGLQLRDAIDRARSAPRGWLTEERRLRREAALAAFMLALAAASLLLLSRIPVPRMPGTDDTGVPTDAGSAMDVAERTVLPEAQASPLVNAQPAVQTQTDANLANRVQQEQNEQLALDKLSKALSSVSAGQSAANAIQQGDFSAARDELQSLGDEADQLSDAAKQQLAQALQDAAATTAQADRQLADREHQAGQALSRSIYNEQRQALRGLGDQVERSGSRSVPADQLARDIGKLQQQQAASQTNGARSQTPGGGLPSGAAAAQSGQQPGPASGAQGGGADGQQGGPGAGSGTDPDMTGNTSRLETAGERVQVPTRLSSGPGARPPDGTEDQIGADPSIGGRTVAELSRAQQTGQVAPEQNLVPGEQRPVVRGYFR